MSSGGRLQLGKADILEGLQRLDAIARDAGVIVDLAIYGGAALSLVFDLRHTTRDVDAVVRGDPTFLREAARRVADEMDWPEDWLNDGVKGFLSANEELEMLPAFSGDTGSGLRIYTPSPQYLFAMKCMAMRPEGIEGSHDISDIEALADVAQINNLAEALDLVQAFYPAGQVPAKVRFGVEEIMTRVQVRRDGRPLENDKPKP